MKVPSTNNAERPEKVMPQDSMRTALELEGLTNLAAVHHNLPTSFLYEEVVRRCEGRLAHLGPLVVRTGHHTGRAPQRELPAVRGRGELRDRERWSGSRPGRRVVMAVDPTAGAPVHEEAR